MSNEFNAFNEIQFAYNKLIYYGQMRWQNIILARWEQAYRTAYEKVNKEQELSGRHFFLAIFGVLIGEVTGMELIFAPIIAGLDLWKGPGPVVPASATQNPNDFVADRKTEFGRMMDVCAKGLLDLQDKVKSGDSFITEDEWREFLGRALLSPIWYPPKEPNAGYLAYRFERRMWAHILLDEKYRNISHKAYPAFKAIPKLGGDDGNVDLGEADRLMQEWAAKRVERDAVGRIDLYRDGGDVAVGWRKWMWPLALEMSRVAPTEFPLPGQVQTYLEQAAKVGAWAAQKGIKPTPKMLTDSALRAGQIGVTRNWAQLLEWWQQTAYKTDSKWISPNA